MISVNTNTASSLAAFNLGSTNAQLQKSLQRLSSGSRISNATDDAGGMGVSMKLSAAIRRTEATQSNVGNAVSFLQTQDGVLRNAERVLVRLSELAQLSTDVTKSTTDKALYQTEYNQLTSALSALALETFNGVALFSTNAGTLDVITSQEGSQSIGITQGTLASIATSVATIGSAMVSASGVGTSEINTLTTAIQHLADLRATNGAEQSRLGFAADMLALNKLNLEAANGRISDVDIASESANLARLSILQQAGTAMLAQANQSTGSLLRLLV